MERLGGDYPQPHPPDYMYPPPPINFDHHHHHQNFPPNFHHHQENFPPDFHHRNPPNPNFHHQNSDHNAHVGEVFDNIPNRNSVPFPGRKRPFSQTGQGAPTDCPEGGSFVKLYVVGFPRTIPEGEVRSIFGEYGHVLEVVLLKDKRTGQQGGMRIIPFSMNHLMTFSCSNCRSAMKHKYKECGFVKYAKLEEADRAVEALNDRYTFSGAPLPVKVRYADKERERLGILFGEHVHKLYVGCINRQASRREVEDIFSPYGIIEDVFIVRNEMSQSRGYAFVRFPRRDMAVAAINALHGTYVMRGCEQPLIVRFADPKKPRTGDAMPTAFTSGPRSGPLPPNNNTTLSQPLQPSRQSLADGVACSYSQPKQVPPSSTSHKSGSSTKDDLVECEWSEHICPDGHSYFYNCITCESRWEKPEQYALYEEQIEKLEQHQTSRQSSLCSSEKVSLQSSLQCQV